MENFLDKAEPYAVIAAYGLALFATVLAIAFLMVETLPQNVVRACCVGVTVTLVRRLINGKV